MGGLSGGVGSGGPTKFEAEARDAGVLKRLGLFWDATFHKSYNSYDQGNNVSMPLRFGGFASQQVCVQIPCGTTCGHDMWERRLGAQGGKLGWKQNKRLDKSSSIFNKALTISFTQGHKILHTNAKCDTRPQLVEQQ